MSISSGRRVTAYDLNTLYSQALLIYGVGTGDYGYGLSALAKPDAIADSAVSASHWLPLFEIMNACALHQNASALTYDVSPTSTMPVVASSTIRDQLDNLVAKRLTSTSPTSAINVITSTYSSTWTGTLSVTFAATFASEDAARFYFNSGGAIDLRLVHPYGSTNADDEWRYASSTNLGSISFGAHSCTNSGVVKGTTTTIGYYELLDTAAEILGVSNVNANAPYSNDQIVVACTASRTNYVGLRGGNGSGLSLTLTFTDTGNLSSLAAGTYVAVDLSYAGSLAGIAPPSIAITASLLPVLS